MTDAIPDRTAGDEDRAPARSGDAAARSAVGPRRGVRSGIVSIIDQGTVSATNFATTLILARLCSQADLGVYYLAWTTVLFITAMQNNLVSVPYTVYSPHRHGESLHTYFGSALVHQVATSLLAILLLLGLVLVVSLGGAPPALRPVALVLLGAMPLITFREFVRRFALAHLQVGAALALDVVVAVVQVGSLALLALFGSLSVPIVYGVMGGACAVASLSWLVFTRHPMRFVPSEIVSDWRQNWGFARWALACQFTGLCFHALPWLLTFTHGAAAAGVLAAATALVGPANLFMNGLWNFLTPKAARAYAGEGRQGLGRVLQKASLAYVVALGAFCLLMVLAGDPLGTLVYGEKYGGIGMVLAMLAFATMVNGLGLTASSGLWAMDRPSANFAADAIQMAVMLAAGVCLVGRFEVLGIAAAIAIGWTVGMAIRWGTLWRLLRMTNCELEPA
jgi:O-antigen/teichoic acid export membrane protein